MEELLSSWSETELDAVALGSEVVKVVERLLKSWAKEELDTSLLTWEMLEIDVEPATVLLASVEL